MENDLTFFASVTTADEASQSVENWLTTGVMHLPPGSVKITESRFVCLPISCYEVFYRAQWSGAVGTVQGTYIMAMNQYNSIMEDYRLREKSGIKVGQYPIKPSERDFLSWSDEYDIFESTYLSGSILRADLSHANLDAHISLWAIKLLKKRKSPPDKAVLSYGTYEEWSAHDPRGRAGVLKPFANEVIASSHSNDIKVQINTEVARRLPKHHSDIHMNWEITREINHWTFLPAYVVTYAANGKTACCLVDATGDLTIVGKKVRSFGAGIRRFFGDKDTRIALTAAGAMLAMMAFFVFVGTSGPPRQLSPQYQPLQTATVEHPQVDASPKAINSDYRSNEDPEPVCGTWPLPQPRAVDYVSSVYRWLDDQFPGKKRYTGTPAMMVQQIVEVCARLPKDDKVRLVMTDEWLSPSIEMPKSDTPYAQPDVRRSQAATIPTEGQLLPARQKIMDPPETTERGCVGEALGQTCGKQAKAINLPPGTVPLATNTAINLRPDTVALASNIAINQRLLTDPPATNCDTLAAFPYDPQRKAAGIDYSRIDAPKAIAECEAAVQRYPNSGRLQFQLGRALEKANEAKRALEAYQRAGELGDAGGSNNLGEIYRDGKWLPQSKNTALAYFSAASSAGYPEGEYNLAVLLLRNTPDRQMIEKADQLLELAARSGYPNALKALRSIPAPSVDTGTSRYITDLIENYKPLIDFAERQRHAADSSRQTAQQAH